MNSVLNEVLNMYLYGTNAAPSVEDLLAGRHIRNPGENPFVGIDLGAYMDNGQEDLLALICSTSLRCSLSSMSLPWSHTGLS